MVSVGVKATESGGKDAAERYILERTSLVYFFANQIPVLEMANVEKAPVPGATGATSTTGTPRSMRRFIETWGDLHKNIANQPAQPQIVAWSDPSDLLSWQVPAIGGFNIVNLPARNNWWHWLLADPLTAHSGYAVNKKVIRTMMGPK